MQATLEIIQGEGRDRTVYRGASNATVSAVLPSYNGEVTMRVVLAESAQSPHTANVTVHPDCHGGVPCVADGRWPIAHILRKLASGYTADHLIRENADLTSADVQLALNIGAWIMRDPAINWTELDLYSMVKLQDELFDWQGLANESLDACDEFPDRR